MSAAVVLAALALAAPANDAPAGATAFQSVTAENGAVTEREAQANLDGATPDAGVPRCLGSASFERTVWFRVEAAGVPRRVKVEATGPTTTPPDLAAFVQGANGVEALAEPQACDGVGSPVADAGEGASVVDLHVPAGRQVLIQAGGREADRLLLSLATTDLTPLAAPPGDHAAQAPLGPGTIPLAGATLTEEDPAQPACPAAASVWRRIDVPVAGRVRLVATGAATLTAFAGGEALACADRRRASVELTVDAPAGPLLVRLGADTWTAPDATLAVATPVAGSAPPPGAAPCADKTRPTVKLASTRTLTRPRGAAAAPAAGDIAAARLADTARVA
ncbi:hypothetical protein OJ997_31085, partial [Solirubrobacter phytolaccae]